MKVEIYIATHKAINSPENPIYIPIHVGKALSSQELEYLPDNINDNISNLNKSFCELTALYWMWKNSSADILGLVHYRRYLKGDRQECKFNNSYVLNDSEVKHILSGHDIIVARSYFLRNLYFFPQSIKTHYYQNHYKKDWIILREILNNNYPEYVGAFNRVEKKITMHSCNIFIAKRNFVENYCKWLFDILFNVEKNINIQDYDVYQKRIFGFMAERLLNVYIEHHKLKIKTQMLLIVK